MKPHHRILLFLKSKFDLIFDLIDNEAIKKNLLNALPFWAGAILSGMAAVVYAKLFAWAETASRFIFENSGWAFLFVTPLCFLFACWLVSRFFPMARGSGIPQVSAAIEFSNPRENHKVNLLLGMRCIVVKIISSLAMALGGGIIGREGPTIQIAGSIFKKINDLLPEWYPKISKRNMIVTGAAAGLAAAFNTPLGGIVFAIEELTKTHFSFFKSALLTGVIISGLTALHFLGSYLYLGYPQLNDVGIGLLWLIIPLALLTGFVGSRLGSGIIYGLKVRNALKNNFQKTAFVALAGMTIASLAFFLDRHILGSGKELMETALFTDQKTLPWHVPFIKFIGAALSFCIGASGGVFAPSLSIGAAIGIVFAGFFNLSPSETNLIILCGMTGFLTSVTRSPFTCSILVIEMTNSHHVIFYIMLTALFAGLTATAASRRSLYDRLKDMYVKEINEKTETKN